MGKGKFSMTEEKSVNHCCNNNNVYKEVTTEELRKHNSRDDQWLLINGKAYDVTQFAKKHPGGAKILNHYAGEDATVSCFLILCIK